jgi:hypothetical protein
MENGEYGLAGCVQRWWVGAQCFHFRNGAGEMILHPIVEKYLIVSLYDTTPLKSKRTLGTDKRNQAAM